jgi:hypothetical protein
MTNISTVFLSGPKPGVDYGAMTARMPQITAEMESIDKAIFNVSPAVVLCLVDERADSQGHLSHLIITKNQRKQMIDGIDRAFGPSLMAKDQNFTVSAAWLVKQGLLRYKMADEAW